MRTVCVSAFLVSCLVARVFSQCVDDCSGHGDCNAGNCLCEEGWTGTNCGTYQCDVHADGCTGHGQCRGSVCVCHSGYGGYNCAGVTTNCPDFCKGHGSCLDGVCTCDPGYAGSDCGLVDSKVACPMNCSGHGFCDVSKETPACYCMPSYWTGDACNIKVSKCPAELNSCTGHGICDPVDSIADDSDWKCTCEAGFCGEKCDVVCPTCPRNCTGHGFCNSGVCECAIGFSGDDCSLVAEVAGCPHNCSGHGLCVGSDGSFACSCEVGYSGPSCTLTTNTCVGNCNGKGECLPDGTCVCQVGTSGLNCEITEKTCIAYKNCSANGLCIDGQCKCNLGFGGDDCSLACSTGGLGDVGCNANLGHGMCISGTCVCKEGEWGGAGCEEPEHRSTLGSVVSTSNPLGVIVVSIVGAAVLAVLVGYGFNFFVRGKRGLNAIPGLDTMKTKQGGDDYEAAPENRYASNY